jgi:hypothetical protein
MKIGPFLSMQNPNQTNGHEPEFQVEGEIVYSAEIREPSGPKQVKHSRRFVVARKGQQWKIWTANLDKDDRFAYGNDYNEMGCDGAKIFELKSFDENNPRLSSVADIITAQGRLGLGDAPAGFDLDFIYPLWLAYCSSNHFLSRQDNRIAAPLFIIGDSFLDVVPPTLSLPAKWKLNDSNFISEIAWHSEGQELGVENGTSRLQYRLHTLPPPFDSGFLRASFETSDWVDFNGMRLPGVFAVKTFFPNQTTGRCDASYAIEAKVQAAHPLQNFSFVPELTKKTRITDTRYRLCYPCSGHPTYASLTWMTEAEVEAKNKSLGIKYEKQSTQG